MHDALTRTTWQVVSGAWIIMMAQMQQPCWIQRMTGRQEPTGEQSLLYRLNKEVSFT
jgi:hypothetical protein